MKPRVVSFDVFDTLLTRAVASPTGLFTLLRFDKRTPVFAAVEHPWLVCRLPKTILAGATIIRD